MVALPQGWMRQRGAGGVVSPQPWEDADLVLPHVQAVVVSHEDIEPFEKEALEWFQRVPVGAVTRGPTGRSSSSTATGTASSRTWRWRRTRPARATSSRPRCSSPTTGTATRGTRPRSAACCAAASVEGEGVAAIPDRAALEARLAAYRRRQGG